MVSSCYSSSVVRALATPAKGPRFQIPVTQVILLFMRRIIEHLEVLLVKSLTSPSEVFVEAATNASFVTKLEKLNKSYDCAISKDCHAES